MSKLRILIAEGRPRVRFALRTLLQQHDGLEVVGEAADAEDVLAQVYARCPDLVLLDWDLPGIATTDLLVMLRGLCPGLPVIALSGRLDRRQAALAAGADRFLSKTEPPERLLEAIRGIGEQEEGKMKYRVHRFDISMTRDQMKLEQFLNNLQGEVVAIIPNVTLGITAPHVDFLLIVEKVG